jgi:predicted nucleic acid-binding Zn ribbon protein
MDREENYCVICGKPIDRFSLYCSNPRCQQQYERKLAIVHNSRAYKFYIMMFRICEEQAINRGDVEHT